MLNMLKTSETMRAAKVLETRRLSKEKEVDNKKIRAELEPMKKISDHTSTLSLFVKEFRIKSLTNTLTSGSTKPPGSGPNITKPPYLLCWCRF